MSRTDRKEATRRRVLDAARELFETEGYDETTVRAIAKRAEVSVGSVFTSFPTKLDILSEVMGERLDELYDELDRVGHQLRGSTADRLRSLFALFFAFETRRKRLFLAHIAATYDWRPGTDARPFGRNERIKQVIRDCLARGVVAGDVDPTVDQEVVVDCLLAAYAWTYRLAAWEDADADAMSRAMDHQIGLLAKGFTPRAQVSALI
ncbi:MAG: TetR/AcrR family transcriptional regulator [Phenylobacterium sp.]|uniref:TetR/AcrR family transcriptional regulator n=1 Tax=Phenylobacterium sp. TaxID=1871053 RepID=UPI002A2DA29A|nr:TetR/AcrR family transcriptional regulator [Phenylobacterium sp.]MDD3836322.1 TetR/AcrR family transcriptional regulator [Phenylobacterium sp.]MDX9997473.1 TetR/AcrR family transcriptional regulator [Phenylobacterium sp.]